jgi:alkylation response protein AidB-like acyl-CoA dehydrogenase
MTQSPYAIPFPRLSPEIYAQIGETARRFADTRVKPLARELDETESFPKDVYAEMGELGLFGITVPEEFGGAGLDALSYALVMEELSRGYASVGGKEARILLHHRGRSGNRCFGCQDDGRARR